MAFYFKLLKGLAYTSWGLTSKIWAEFTHNLPTLTSDFPKTRHGKFHGIPVLNYLKWRRNSHLHTPQVKGSEMQAHQDRGWWFRSFLEGLSYNLWKKEKDCEFANDPEIWKSLSNQPWLCDIMCIIHLEHPRTQMTIVLEDLTNKKEGQTVKKRDLGWSRYIYILHVFGGMRFSNIFQVLSALQFVSSGPKP